MSCEVPALPFQAHANYGPFQTLLYTAILIFIIQDGERSSLFSYLFKNGEKCEKSNTIDEKKILFF